MAEFGILINLILLAILGNLDLESPIMAIVVFVIVNVAYLTLSYKFLKK